MTILIIILKYLLMLLSTTLGFLVYVTFTKSSRKKYPILSKTDGRQIPIIILFLISLALNYLLSGIQEYNYAKKLDTIFSSKGMAFLKANESFFESEMENFVGNLLLEARLRFQSGLIAMGERDFQTAIKDFNKSLNNIPTMSAYLNLGSSYASISEYVLADSAFSEGRILARKMNSLAMLVLFDLSRGGVQFGLGNYTEALKLLSNAVELNKATEDEIIEIVGRANMGLIHYQQGNYEESLKEYQKISKFASKNDIAFAMALVLQGEANVQYINGNIDISIKLYQEALNIFEMDNSQYGQAIASLGLGIVYLELGSLEEANHKLKNAHNLFIDLGILSGIAGAELELGNLYDKKGDFQLAKEFMNAALLKFRDIKQPFGEAVSLINIGRIYRRKENFTKALEYQLKALQILRILGNPLQEANALTELANIKLAENKFEEAFRNNKSALKINRELGYIQGIAGNLKYQSRILFKQGKLSDALSSVEESVGLYLQLKDLLQLTVSYDLMGNIYADLGKLEMSLNAKNMALKYAADMNDDQLEAFAHTRIGYIFIRKESYSNALKSFQESLKIHSTTFDSLGQARDLQNIAIVMYKLGKLKEAVHMFNEAISMSNLYNNPGELAINYFNLGKLYFEENEFDSTIKYVSRSQHLNNSMGKGSDEANDYRILGDTFSKLSKYDDALNSYYSAKYIFERLDGTSNVLAKIDSSIQVITKLSRLSITE